MSSSPKSFGLALLLLTLLTLGSAPAAFAAPAAGEASPVFAKATWPKVDLKKVAPKVKFRAKAKLKRNSVKLAFSATIQIAGKTIRVPIFNMGIKKTKKAIQVKRKIGKLRVSLKISWAGERTITIRGTARYLRFKVPVPKIKLKI